MKIFYYLDQVKQYLECYGIYYICYPICGLICLAGILSPILNEYLLFLCLCGSHDPQATPNPLYRSRYQGFCWFPYISEVSKEGFLYYPFLIGTSISIIPWIVSMFHYMKLNLQVFYLHVDNYFLRLIFRLMEHIIFMLQVSACLCLFLASLFNIYSYPDFHEDVTTWVCVAGNLSFWIDYAICKFINRQLYELQGTRKILTIFVSAISVILFGTLNFRKGCTVEFLPLSTCFQITSFDRCIYGIDPNDSSSTPISALSTHVLVTLYRYYPHCPLLHWSRGFCEYIAILSSFYYINLMCNDMIYQHIYLYDQTGICDNMFYYNYISQYKRSYRHLDQSKKVKDKQD